MLCFNSFSKWNSLIRVSKNKKKKFFSFYFIFYLFSQFSKIVIHTFIRFKRKMVVLKSPFHFKLFKHHITYSFYTIKCWFFFFEKFLSKFSFFINFISTINRFRKSQITFKEVLKLSEFYND